MSSDICGSAGNQPSLAGVLHLPEGVRNRKTFQPNLFQHIHAGVFTNPNLRKMNHVFTPGSYAVNHTCKGYTESLEKGCMLKYILNMQRCP